MMMKSFFQFWSRWLYRSEMGRWRHITNLRVLEDWCNKI